MPQNGFSVMSFIFKKDCRVGKFRKVKEDLFAIQDFGEYQGFSLGGLKVSVSSESRPILGLPENGGKQCPKNNNKHLIKVDLDVDHERMKGLIYGNFGSQMILSFEH